MFLRKAQEDSYSYSEEEDILKETNFTHIYEIQKFGSCPIEEIEALIKIPIYLKEEGNEFQIIEILQIKGLIDNREVSCSSLKKENDKHNPTISLTTNEIFENFHPRENSFKYIPPENRTLYINCSNSFISCQSIKCKLTGLLNSTSMKIIINMKFQPKILQCK